MSSTTRNERPYAETYERPLAIPCIAPAGAIRAISTEISINGSAIFARNSAGTDGGKRIGGTGIG